MNFELSDKERAILLDALSCREAFELEDVDFTQNDLDKLRIKLEELK